MMIANTLALLGGLAFFLFGMSLLGEGLKRVAGSKMEIILGKLTSTTFKGVLLGTLVTAVIQSSSATTVMVVGFVNSGIMQLTNAVGIIMGANIGTTATGWILVLAGVEGNGAFSSATVFALVAFIGIILYFFCKKQTAKNIGMILLALSVLMSGMQTMRGSMESLKSSPLFLDFISAVSNPFVALLVGIIVTAIIQSCSASIGILQALAVTSVIGYDVAVPMVVGMCIGACTPVLISAIGANTNGKRSAFIYLIFNLFGAILLLIPFYIVHAFVHFEFMDMLAESHGIAVINTIFNLFATILLMPFSKILVRVVSLFIKDKADYEEEYEENLLDDRLLDYPSVALEQCGKTMGQMSGASFKNIRNSIELISGFNQDKYNKIMSREEKIDRFEDRLGSYLVRLHTRQLNDSETSLSARFLSYLTNVERLSDHSVNIAELALELHNKKISFSSKAVNDLNVCLDAIIEICELTQNAMENMDYMLAGKVKPLEEIVNVMSKEIKSGHVQRVQNGQCTLELGFIFNDLLNNFERIAAHCSNIAITLLESQDSHLKEHDYVGTLDRTNQNTYELQFQFYKNKYLDNVRIN
ncbi:MAG: Na/Pi cotransporter family protein [Clostridia bacterium]|nr:Na/Pi cotransporter family protein [Clostridia bacterium]